MLARLNYYLPAFNMTRHTADKLRALQMNSIESIMSNEEIDWTDFLYLNYMRWAIDLPMETLDSWLKK
jgi:hypothetical protein